MNMEYSDQAKCLIYGFLFLVIIMLLLDYYFQTGLFTKTQEGFYGYGRYGRYGGYYGYPYGYYGNYWSSWYNPWYYNWGWWGTNPYAYYSLWY